MILGYITGCKRKQQNIWPLCENFTILTDKNAAINETLKFNSA